MSIDIARESKVEKARATRRPQALP